jgi:hypothetical protein
MANQAIALQSRAPQGNFLAPAIQQGAQFINMMSQQRAAERQAAAQQQQLEIARAAEGRAARGEDIATRKADQDYVASRVAYFQNQLPSVKDDASWNNWLNQVSKEDPEYAGEMRRVSGGRYDPDYVDRVSMTAEAFINKRIATPMASLQIGADNKTYSAVVGGTNPSVTPLTVAPAPSATVSGVPARAAPATPAPAPSAPAAGGMFQPISATGGQQQGENPATVALAASLTKAQGTKRIDAGTVEQIKTMIQPELVDRFIQVNNIKVAPGGGMRSAVYRPGEDAAPQMQMVQAFNRPGSQFQVAKDPTQSPAASAPGIYRVPTPQIAGAAAAEEGGKQGARVVTEPKIVAGTERVKRLEKLRGDQPLALSDAKSVITDMDDRIAAIDEFLRSPNRRSIIGAVEGRIPRIAQNERRADVQALYDSIVSNQVLNELIKGRQQTETGASPQGIVSDKDLAIAAQASNRLTQTGSEEVQEREMQRLRDVLYRTRQLAIKTYGDTYREVAKDAPELRLDAAPIADRYKAVPNGPENKTQRGSAIDALIKKYGG